jgi:alkylhydroperoxidase family enzyme
MIDWILERMIRAFEARYDYDMTYAREMLRFDSSAARAFVRATRLLQGRGALPLDILFTAKVVASRSADCGPCLQLVVKMAEEANVSQPLLTALLRREYKGLSPDQRLVAEFVEASLARDEQADDLREAVKERLGGACLVRLALLMAVAHVYPIVKFALGHGRACTRTKVGEVWVSPAPLEAAAE